MASVGMLAWPDPQPPPRDITPLMSSNGCTIISTSLCHSCVHRRLRMGRRSHCRIPTARCRDEFESSSGTLGRAWDSFFLFDRPSVILCTSVDINARPVQNIQPPTQARLVYNRPSCKPNLRLCVCDRVAVVR